MLTILEGNRAIEQAQALMTRARSAVEMISTIIIYKFKSLSRDEVNAMLGYVIDELKQTRVYQEAKAEEATSLILRLLTRRLHLQSLPETLRSQVERLSLPQLENLSEALLDFQTLADLEGWLGQNG